MNEGAADLDAALARLLRGAVECVRAEELRERHRRARAEGRPLRVKLGMDPTAPDLHLGHAVVLRKLRQFQDAGHEAVLIIGGATAMLGDPTGKDRMRPRLTREEVKANARTYLEQATRILRADRLTVLDNADWLMKLDFPGFIELVSRMTVARMVERDLFARRLREGVPLGIHEFLYPLLQGWDSVQVRADVELGGSDQLFNLLVGRDLQEQVGQPPQVCLTVPLLVGLDGAMKMSKSLGNLVGLAFEPEDMFGKIMSIPDAQMPSYFLLLTDVDEKDIKERLAEHPRELKADLAWRVVAWLHGEDRADAAREQFDRVFREHQAPREVELVEVDPEDAPGGRMWIVRLLVLAGFAGTNSEARRLVQGRGVKIDGQVVDGHEDEVDLGTERLLQVGRRRFARVAVRR